MNVKKIIVGITALSMLLCGCGKSNSDMTAAVSDTTDTTVSTISAEELEAMREEARQNMESAEQLTAETVSLEELDVFAGVALKYDGFSPNISVSVDTSNMGKFINENVTYTVSPNSGLANGDKVTITALYNNTVMEENGYTVSNDIMEMTVEGSEIAEEDLITIDVKDYVLLMSGICYTDENLFVIAAMSDPYDNDAVPDKDLQFIFNIVYNGEESTSLYIPQGEKFTVKVSYYDETYVQEHGYVLKNTSFEATAWNPEEAGKGVCMWYDQNGNSFYANEIPY